MCWPGCQPAVPSWLKQRSRYGAAATGAAGLHAALCGMSAVRKCVAARVCVRAAL